MRCCSQGSEIEFYKPKKSQNKSLIYEMPNIDVEREDPESQVTLMWFALRCILLPEEGRVRGGRGWVGQGGPRCSGEFRFYPKGSGERKVLNASRHA